MEEYTWICIRFDDVGLFTADLRVNNETVDTLGGSYPRFMAAKFDAWRKWGNKLPVHGRGYVHTSPDEEYDLAEEIG